VCTRSVSVFRATSLFQREAAGDRILAITGDQASYIAESRWVAGMHVSAFRPRGSLACNRRRALDNDDTSTTARRSRRRQNRTLAWRTKRTGIPATRRDYANRFRDCTRARHHHITPPAPRAPRRHRCAPATP